MPIPYMCHRLFNSHSIQHHWSGIHITYSRNSDATKPGHPRQPTFIIVVDDKQTRPSRLLPFTLTLTKHFNPLSGACATGEESSHNISGLSCFFGTLQSVMSYKQMDTPKPFLPSDSHQQATPPPTTNMQQEPQQQQAQNQPPQHPFEPKQQQ